MKKRTMKIGAVLLSCAMVLSNSGMTAFASGVKNQPDSLKIGIMSDTHYFSKELYSDCPDFTKDMNSDRKMLKESSAIFDSSLEEMVREQPDVVMISGDLTKDGEEVNHRAVARKLAEAQKKLPKTKFYVINGNHDINNPNGKDYTSGNAVIADTTTVEEFREIYKEFGYGDDTEKYKPEGNDGGSLSYVAHPAKGYTLIAVDSCKYSKDQTSTQTDIQETSGVISQELLNWITKQANKAKSNGDVVMILEHHGVLPHFTEEPTVMKEYLVDNWEDVRNQYADSGVSYVFTGHMHANDIAEYTTDAGNKIYDIETGSLVTYPSLFRSVTIQNGTKKTQDGNSLVSEMKSTGTVKYTDFDTNELHTIENLTEYAQQHMLTPEVICTMINEWLLAPELESLAANGGVKGMVAQLLGVEKEQASVALASMLTGLLPATKDTALPLDIQGLKFLVYYSADEREIIIEQANNTTYSNAPEGVLVIPREDGEDITITLPEELLNTIAQDFSEETDTNMGADAEKDTTKIGGLVGGLIPKTLIIPDAKLVATIDTLLGQTDTLLGGENVQVIITELVTHILNSKVDDTHTIFDVVNQVYQMHLAGDEQSIEWLDKAITQIKDSSLISNIIKDSINDSTGVIKEILKGLSISMGELFEEPGLILGNITLDGSMLVDMVGGKLGDLIPDSTLVPVNEVAYKVVYSMSNDENCKDLNTKIIIEGTKAWEKAEGENQGQTTPNENQNPETKPGNIDKTGSKDAPKTGDASSLAVVTLLMLGSAGIYIILKRKAFEKENIMK